VKGTGILVALAVVLVLLAAGQLVIVYRYMRARDDVIGEAERTVIRHQLDQENGEQ
jgi:hypothetical protein